jgi:hypothetical protein
MLAPFLFADGTLSNPGAAWANAPGTGFYRDTSHLGFVWNGAEIVSYNANGLTGKFGAMSLAGSLIVQTPYVVAWRKPDLTDMWELGTETTNEWYLWNHVIDQYAIRVDQGSNNVGINANYEFRVATDNEASSKYLRAVTPDGFGRAAIEFETTVSGAGSDSYIKFWTNKFGVDRAVRMSIEPTGLAKFFKGMTVDGPLVANGDLSVTALSVRAATSLLLRLLDLPLRPLMDLAPRGRLLAVRSLASVNLASTTSGLPIGRCSSR